MNAIESAELYHVDGQYMILNSSQPIKVADYFKNVELESLSWIKSDSYVLCTLEKVVAYSAIGEVIWEVVPPYGDSAYHARAVGINNGLMISWREDSRLFLQRYDNTGLAVGEKVDLGVATEYSIAQSDAGKFLLVLAGSDIVSEYDAAGVLDPMSRTLHLTPCRQRSDEA